jgi:hypothetical protein
MRAVLQTPVHAAGPLLHTAFLRFRNWLARRRAKARFKTRRSRAQ